VSAPPYTVRLLEDAADDLRDIHTYLVDQGAQEAADSLVDALLEKIETLRHFPSRGSVPREFEELGFADFRQIVMPSYRIFYEVVEQEVVILLVADARRDMRALIQAFLLNHRPEDP
jgi:toxin ParE1/3/4